MDFPQLAVSFVPFAALPTHLMPHVTHERPNKCVQLLGCLDLGSGK